MKKQKTKKQKNKKNKKKRLGQIFTFFFFNHFLTILFVFFFFSSSAGSSFLFCRLRHVRDNDLFPSSFMLLRLESKYGEAISLVDMDGQSLIMDPNATLADDDSEEDEDEDEMFDPRTLRNENNENAENTETTTIKKKKTKMIDFDAVPEVPKKRKADTDCTLKISKVKI